MLIDSWSTEFTQFVDSVTEIIAAKDKVDSNDARQSVKKGYRKYLIPMLIGQVVEFQEKPSITKRIKYQIQNLNADHQLRKTLRRWFQTYQDLTDSTPRPRPISPSSPRFNKIEHINNFLTSTEETDCKNIE